MFNKVLACFSFIAAAEKHAMGHDCGHLTVRLKHREHMLHEHQVSFFAFFRHPHGKPAWIFDIFPDVILAKWRISENAVITLELVVFTLVLRTAYCVLLTYIGVRNAVEEHVHFADGPRCANALLSVQRKITRIPTAFTDIVAGLDQHASRADGGIVNTHLRLRVDDLHQGTYDICPRVTLSSFLAGRSRKEFE